MTKAKTVAKRGAKRALRNLHPITKFTAITMLLIGIALGAVAAIIVAKNDCFALKGEKNYTVSLGSEFYYTEEGVEAYCFGFDVSDKLCVETSLEKDAEGRYIIPTDKEGFYTITYTVDCFKFGENSPNGGIKRVRTFAVSAEQEVEGDGT